MQASTVIIINKKPSLATIKLTCRRPRPHIYELNLETALHLGAESHSLADSIHNQ